MSSDRERMSSDREPSSPEWGTAAPSFQPMPIVAKRSPISATAEHLLTVTKKDVVSTSLDKESQRSEYIHPRSTSGYAPECLQNMKCRPALSQQKETIRSLQLAEGWFHGRIQDFGGSMLHNFGVLPEST